MDWTAPSLTSEPPLVVRNRVTGQAIRCHKYQVGLALAPVTVVIGSSRSLKRPSTVTVSALTIRRERVSRATATSTTSAPATATMVACQTGPDAATTAMAVARAEASPMRRPVDHGVER
ncbi:MAG TPA: hypothetical protein DCQ30_01465 [Acidimicrobiaceae bacterium]|nr:hypothetical protein [Acidimicrobiaceae bacterium]